MPDKKTKNPAHRAPDNGSGGAGTETTAAEPAKTVRRQPRATQIDYRARFFNRNRDAESFAGYDPDTGW